MIAQRPDVQVFQTGSLTKPIKTAGPVRVRLFVNSSAPGADFVAR